MRAVVYKKKGLVILEDRPMPVIREPGDVIIRVTLTTICSSDIHIKHGAVPRAEEDTVLGHEFVGVVAETGPDVKKFKKGDRVAVNVETFCGECYFCRRGYVNNCTHKDGGWALGCRIDGKNLIFKTGGVDASNCSEIMRLIQAGKLDASCLITHRTNFDGIMEAYDVFENKRDCVIKYAIRP